MVYDGHFFGKFAANGRFTMAERVDDRVFTQRTPRMVGRKAEVERLRKWLHARGERHYIYYKARGGLGKTRLLQELERMVQEAGEKFYYTGIIDLYHTDLHSSSDIERAIVNGLDREGKFFAEYRRQRREFELLRERGVDPGVQREMRERLGRAFVKGSNDMALEARKLVISIDTLELLQHESLVVEEMAGLDAVEARIKPWLLHNLAQLRNVLVVFAGRPKESQPEDEVNRQQRLEDDLGEAFKRDLEIVELPPLNREETAEFINELNPEVASELAGERWLPVVHKLTGGRPILLHLVVDLIATLAPEPKRVFDLFDRYASLVDAEEGDPELERAREKVEKELARAVFDESGELGLYLNRIALMPKGIDAKILEVALGMPPEEAENLLERLAPLSFVKRFTPLPLKSSYHAERTFLHDEMYRLMAQVSPLRYVNERSIARSLVTDYYDPLLGGIDRQIEELEGKERELRVQTGQGEKARERREQLQTERVGLRERQQKLQVERLYYRLVQDPVAAYKEYKKLTHEANRRRWVGFSMRLLDEFLRFYNERREYFERVGIAYEQVIRDSAWMWVERFDWWGLDERVVKFAGQVLDEPQWVHIDPEGHIDVLANVCAFWAGARARLYGYEKETVKKAEEMLARLPPLDRSSAMETLARARLETAIGFQYRQGGYPDQAWKHYRYARTAFRELGSDLPDYYDEYALLLVNLASVYTVLGRLPQARALAHEAGRINEQIGSEYGQFLTFYVLSSIARVRASYDKAKSYAEKSLDLARRMGYARGVVLAHLRLAQALRWEAKHEYEKGFDLELAWRLLERASEAIVAALQEADEARLEALKPELMAAKGRIHREKGRVAKEIGYESDSIANYNQAIEDLRKAMEKGEWALTDKADLMQDLAEAYFRSGNIGKAEEILQEIEGLFSKHLIVPEEGKQPSEELPREPLYILGKVEALRAELEFASEKWKEGLRHYLLAYAYFRYFSPDAVQVDDMVEYFYKYFTAFANRRQVMEGAEELVQELNLGIDVSEFLQDLQDLLGAQG